MATQLDALFVDIFFKGDQRALDNFKRGWKQLDDRIKDTQQTLDRFAKRFAVVGAIGSAAMGLLGKVGLDTEEALLRTRAALGLTEAQMRTLREEALKIGSELPLNTKDIVNAQLAYGKLGATFEEILRDVPAIAGAAVATGLHPEQVATYARIIQNVFGGDVQENLDMLLRTANQSPSKFAELGEAIKFSGQSAVDAGMDFRTYLATLGSTAGAGRSVESVSQGMAAMFIRLAKGTENTGVGGKRLIDVFGDVGINFRDVKAAMDGTSEGFIRVLRLINEAGLSTSQLTALLGTLAGESYAASISYAVQNPEKLDKLLAAIDSSTGEVVRYQEIMMSGASGGLKEMMAQIDTLLNRLAQFGVLTAIETFTRGISKLVSWLTETNEEEELVRGGLLRMVTIIGGLLAALLPLGIALKALSFALSGFVVLVKAARGVVWLWRNALLATRIQMALATVHLKLSALATWLNTAATKANMATLWGRVTALLASRAAMLASVAATGAATAATWGFNAALLANPLTWIVLGIAALIAGIVLLVKHWDTVTDALKAVWNFIKGNWQEIAGLLLLPILGPFALIATNAFGLRDKLLGVFKEIWNWFRDSPVFGPLIDGATQAIEMIKTLLDWAGKIEGAFSWVKSKLGFGEDEGDPNAPSFGRGGMVPGPTGRPLAAVVHGGEMILPPDVARVMSNLMRGPASTPSALYPVPALAGPTYSTQTMSKASEINIEFSGDIVINAPHGSDPQEIARIVNEEIGERFRDVVHNFDDGILR